MRINFHSFACLILVTLLLTGCSDKTRTERSAIELVSSYVEIRDDGYDDFEKLTGTQLVSLNYFFVLKNNSDETLGGMEKLNRRMFRFDDGLELTIEPNNKLKKVLSEVLGVDDFRDYGFGRSGMPNIEPGMEEEYIFDIVLGATNENPEIQLVPPQEHLDMLVRHSMEAVLIVSIEGEEIAIFDLSKQK